MTELTPTDLRNVLYGLTGRKPNPSDTPNQLVEDLSGQLEGVFTFTILDEDGEVVRQQEHNTLVDEGRNELLQLITDQPTQQTSTFSGDGSQQTFQLSYPYRPVHSINSVSVGGTAQTWGVDYAVRYETGEIYFTSAPASGTDNISVDFNYSVHPFNWLAVGTDGSSVADGQTSLGSEAARIAPDSNYFQQDEGNVSVSGRWTFGTGEANVSIAEAALFAVPSSAPLTGSMFNRTVVSPTIDKTSSQELQVTWSLSMWTGSVQSGFAHVSEFMPPGPPPAHTDRCAASTRGRVRQVGEAGSVCSPLRSRSLQLCTTACTDPRGAFRGFTGLLG